MRAGGVLAILLVGLVLAATVAFCAPEALASRPKPLAARGPIRITSDAEFTPENGVISGSGTFVDPYVIGGWAIETTGTPAIEIIGTTAYFVIATCLLKAEGSAAVRLQNVQNCPGIEGCRIKDSEIGVEVVGSTDVYVGAATIIRNCEIGVRIADCGLVFVTQVSILSCADGVVFSGTNAECYVHNCFIHDVTHGVMNEETLGTIGISATMVWDAEVGFYLSGTISEAIVTNSTVADTNGDGILIEATDCFIAGCVVAYAGETGIHLHGLSSGDVHCNEAVSCLTGIAAMDCRSLLISYNIIKSNDLGMLLQDTTDSMVNRNDFVDNSNQARDTTGANTWCYPGIHRGNYWSDHSGPDSDGDGVIDVPYTGDGFTDMYPLVEPVRYDVDTEGPEISDLEFNPTSPSPDQPVDVNVDVVDVEAGLIEVVLLFSTGAGWKEVPMVPTIPWDAHEPMEFYAAIPPQPAGTTVVFKVRARDAYGNTSESPEQSYTVAGGGPGPPPPGPGPGPSPGEGPTLALSPTLMLIIAIVVIVVIVAVVAAVLVRRRKAPTPTYPYYPPPPPPPPPSG